ncbi:hypothetical protein R6Q59_024796 [Mikania micrantha]
MLVLWQQIIYFNRFLNKLAIMFCCQIYMQSRQMERCDNPSVNHESQRSQKEPGVSNVELNDEVHSFLAGDQSHPQSKQIYEELDIIVGKMRELGYVPEIDSALHDIEDEDKGNHLAVHSEKLAIVFVIINTEPFTPIRITKNLRVCEDCHIAAKLISKIVDREIILRDTNRFHHFKNGFCSCGDYW